MSAMIDEKILQIDQLQEQVEKAKEGKYRSVKVNLVSGDVLESEVLVGLARGD